MDLHNRQHQPSFDVSPYTYFILNNKISAVDALLKQQAPNACFNDFLTAVLIPEGAVPMFCLLGLELGLPRTNDLIGELYDEAGKSSVYELFDILQKQYHQNLARRDRTATPERLAQWEEREGSLAELLKAGYHGTLEPPYWVSEVSSEGIVQAMWKQRRPSNSRSAVPKKLLPPRQKKTRPNRFWPFMTCTGTLPPDDGAEGRRAPRGRAV